MCVSPSRKRTHRPKRLLLLLFLQFCRCSSKNSAALHGERADLGWLFEPTPGMAGIVSFVLLSALFDIRDDPACWVKRNCMASAGLPQFPLPGFVILGTFHGAYHLFFMVWPFLSILLYRDYGTSRRP